jgi:hypothetical protein
VRTLTKSDILSVADVTVREVPVPEWGGAVMVKTLSGAERDAWEASRGLGGDGPRDLVNVRASLCVRAIVDEDGNRLFADDEIAVLGEKSAAALDRVYAVAADLSKVSEDDIAELEGN